MRAAMRVSDMSGASAVDGRRLRPGGRPPNPPRDRSESIDALRLGQRTRRRLRLVRANTLADVEAYGADGLAALGFGWRSITAISRALRKLGRDLPGASERGAPKIARMRCPVCGWRGCRSRALLGAECPTCGATTLGPRPRKPAKSEFAKFVRVELYLPPELVRRMFDGVPPRGRSRAARELLAIGLRHCTK